jgi:hypothetical protein
MPIPQLVPDFQTWATSGTVATNAAIERVMDNAAYTSAHPDDTFVFAGPPRLPAVGSSVSDANAVYHAFSAIGMLQNITFNQSKPFQPMMAIGSSRSFYLGGKAQGSAQIGRLFMNTESLMKRLYDNIITAGGGDSFLTGFDSGNPAVDSNNKNFVINLDSELFLIPFGLGVIFKNKARDAIGGFYVELCVIPNYTVSITAGQSMIMEGVSIMYDRLFPLGVAPSNALLSVLDKSIITPDGTAPVAS